MARTVARIIYGANLLADIMAHQPEFVRKVYHLAQFYRTAREIARAMGK